MEEFKTSKVSKKKENENWIKRERVICFVLFGFLGWEHFEAIYENVLRKGSRHRETQEISCDCIERVWKENSRFRWYYRWPCKRDYWICTFFLKNILFIIFRKIELRAFGDKERMEYLVKWWVKWGEISLKKIWFMAGAYWGKKENSKEEKEEES